MSDSARPGLRIVRGAPTAEELAALTALVSASGGSGAESAAIERRGGWNDPALGFRRQLHPGPNGWRGSARPR